jgi:hypothetical protein
MTPLFHPAASLMLVGCDDVVAEECLGAFPGLLVLRVAHAAAAVERMLVTRPLVVLLGEELAQGREDGLVIECANDIRAEIVRLGSVPRIDLHASIRASLLIAESNREEPTLPPTPRR